MQSRDSKINVRNKHPLDIFSLQTHLAISPLKKKLATP